MNMADQAEHSNAVTQGREGEIVEQQGPIVLVPRSPWRTLRVSVIFGLTALIFFVAGAGLASRALTEDVRGGGRIMSAEAAALSFLLSLANIIILGLASRRPFAILAAGIQLHGVDVPWSKVASCRWSRLTPGDLIIKTRLPDARFSAWIPATHRPVVEARLRDFGKWGN